MNKNQSMSQYNEIIQDLEQLVTMCENNIESDSMYSDYINKVGSFLLNIISLENNLDSEYFETSSIESLQEQNEELFKDITVSNYDKSYANPKYCVDLYGEEIGKILSFLYTELRGCIADAYEHSIKDIMIFSELFLDICKNLIDNNDGKVSDINKLIQEFYNNHVEYFTEKSLNTQFDPSANIAYDIIMIVTIVN